MNPSRNLFLVGPMGAGKSTLGRRLADHFGLPFVDLDQVIEQDSGASIPLIFEHQGESGFRDREARLLDVETQRQGIVLATGGGAVLRPENRLRLAERGFVVWLNTRVDTQWSRLQRDRHRPLLQIADPQARLDTMAVERNPLYAAIADHIWTDPALHPTQAAPLLIAEVTRHWNRLPHD